MIRRCNEVNVVKIILGIIFLIDCIALTIVVLMQEGKQQGLGAIAGAAETYWGKNKGRSMEGGLVKATTVMGILFFVLAVVLNILG
nr:preprotein translocase subunit SecG [Blautia difficilis]